MELRIDQQYAKIGLDIKKPRIDLNIDKPRIEINTSPSKLEIHNPAPVLHIDQSQCFADAGLRNNELFRQYRSQLALSDFASGLDRVVSEGHILAAFEKGGSISQVSFDRCNPPPDNYTISEIPKQPPRTWFDTYPVSFRFTPAKVDLKLHWGKVDNNFDWGRVNVYLTQKNYLHINWVPGKLDIKV